MRVHKQHGGSVIDFSVNYRYGTLFSKKIVFEKENPSECTRGVAVSENNRGSAATVYPCSTRNQDFMHRFTPCGR